MRRVARSAFAVLALSVALSGAPSWARPAARGSVGARISGVVNLNSASVRELDLLPGVGEKVALRILEHRKKKPFSTVEELAGVKGFGKKRVAKLRPMLTVQGPTTIKRLAQSKAPSREGLGVPEAGKAQSAPVVSGRRPPGS